MVSKQFLLLWCQTACGNYNIPMKNFTKHWRNGKAFCALLAYHRPDLLDYAVVPDDQIPCLEMAFKVAKKAGIEIFLDIEDLTISSPDKMSIMTQVIEFFINLKSSHRTSMANSKQMSGIHVFPGNIQKNNTNTANVSSNSLNNTTPKPLTAGTSGTHATSENTNNRSFNNSGAVEATPTAPTTSVNPPRKNLFVSTQRLDSSQSVMNKNDNSSNSTARKPMLKTIAIIGRDVTQERHQKAKSQPRKTDSTPLESDRLQKNNDSNVDSPKVMGSDQEMNQEMNQEIHQEMHQDSDNKTKENDQKAIPPQQPSQSQQNQHKNPPSLLNDGLLPPVTTLNPELSSVEPEKQSTPTSKPLVGTFLFVPTFENNSIPDDSDFTSTSMSLTTNSKHLSNEKDNWNVIIPLHYSKRTATGKLYTVFQIHIEIQSGENTLSRVVERNFNQICQFHMRLTTSHPNLKSVLKFPSSALSLMMLRGSPKHITQGTYLLRQNLEYYFRNTFSHQTVQTSLYTLSFLDPLASPSAEILLEKCLKSGFLQKRGQKNTNWKNRWFILTMNGLFYYKSADDPSPAGVIPLNRAKICKTSPDKQTSFINSKRKKGLEFAIIAHPEEDSARAITYCIRAPSEELKAEWLNCLALVSKSNHLDDEIL